ncbi:MAG: cytochrome P450 [Chloroflexales bacterium]|nr:cytochrome P450 [Chloroflexales bacterium]
MSRVGYFRFSESLIALLQHPDQLALLKRDPTLIISAVEEFLRYDSPVETSTLRFAREDVVIGDQVIPRGEMVLVVLGSANRDEAQFTQPDDLDITRERNRHLAFGHGILRCRWRGSHMFISPASARYDWRARCT